MSRGGSGCDSATRCCGMREKKNKKKRSGRRLKGELSRACLLQKCTSKALKTNLPVSGGCPETLPCGTPRNHADRVICGGRDNMHLNGIIFNYFAPAPGATTAILGIRRKYGNRRDWTVRARPSHVAAPRTEGPSALYRASQEQTCWARMGIAPQLMKSCLASSQRETDHRQKHSSYRSCALLSPPCEERSEKENGTGGRGEMNTNEQAKRKNGRGGRTEGIRRALRMHPGCSSPDSGGCTVVPTLTQEDGSRHGGGGIPEPERHRGREKTGG